jgi:formylglycine-generating enzyme required for sulfatase activity
MQHRVINLFVSSVTDEFGAFRPLLAANLTQSGVINVIVQEGLLSTGTDTLPKLDDYIRLCDFVLHVVGDQTGGPPKRTEVPDLLARYPDLVSKLKLNGQELAALTRTQWEAWLAVYHGKDLYIATPLPNAPRDKPVADEAAAQDQRQRQTEHLARLSQHVHKDRLHFDSYPALLNQLHQALHMMQAKRAVPAGSAADPATLAHLAALRSRVLDNPNAAPLGESALQAIDRLVPATREQFHLRQIAHWSRAVYQIDSRFTPLALRLNVEDDKVDKSYDDLRKVLRFLESKHLHALTVLGPPGAGKSTLLRRLGYDLAIDALRSPGDPARLPFYAELRDFKLTAQSTTPRAWLAEQWKARNYQHLGEFEDLLASGCLLLLLDAVNEMPCAADEYDSLLGLWNTFISPNSLPSGNQVVFSCRRLDYSRGLRIENQTIAHVEVESLGPDQIKQFLQLYLPGRDDLVKATYAALETENTFDLYNSPFYLGLLVDLVKQGGAVPRGRAALFSACVRKALQREQASNKLFARAGPLLSAEDFDQVDQAAWATQHDLPQDSGLFEGLTALAHGMQTHGGGTDLARRRVLRSKTETARVLLASQAKGGTSADDMLSGAQALHLLERDVQTREVQFRHQLFQEYFAARGLVAQLAAASPHDHQALAQTIAALARQPWRVIDIRPTVEEELARLSMAERLPQLQPTGWEETLKLAVAMADAPAPLLHALAATNLPLAGLCAAQPEVRMDDALRHPLRQQLLARSRDVAADLRARIAAGLALGELGDPRLTPASAPGHGSGVNRALLPPFATIAAGDYPVGVALDQIPEADRQYFEDAAPARVTVAVFEMAQFPVTNAQWRCFMEAKGYDDAQWWHSEAAQAWRQGIGTSDANRRNWRQFRGLGQDASWLEAWRERTGNEDDYKRIKAWAEMDDTSFEDMLLEQVKDQTFTEPSVWRNPAFNAASQPVVGVCWFEAQAYCAWLSATAGTAGTVAKYSFRLPTEIEREVATGGVAGRTFAWGEAWQATCSNNAETRIKNTVPVGVFPPGDTPEGLCDLSGNVLEWTSTLYRPTIDGREDGREDPNTHQNDKGEPLARVVRGASWVFDAVKARSACRFNVVPGFRYLSLGFRVVRVSHP